MKWRVAITLAAMLVPAMARGQDDPAARIAAGKRTFDAVGCSGCHGFAGQGGIGPMAGPRIAHLPAEALIGIVRHPPQPMPPYAAAVLSDARIREIADYLHTQAPPRAVDTVPMIPAAKLTGDLAGKPARR